MKYGKLIQIGKRQSDRQMIDSISQMEPLLPTKAEELEDMALKVVSRSASLGGQLHPVTQRTVVELLRIINSYYSNLIEGHSTHPIDIALAMQKQYSDDPAKRNLQMESIAHIEVQRLIEGRLLEEATVNVAGASFLCWIHREFYDRLTPEMRFVTHADTPETAEVVPGAMRDRDVAVGRHIGPPASSLASFLDRFSSFYRSGAHHGLLPIIATAASHHRLMWIHPFLDGNGRVTRLYTDACFLRFPLAGYGLWNVSRGLARKRNDYMAALAMGDLPRRNDLDGRGALSNEGLIGFCRFFLSVCLDQIGFMSSLLQLDSLLDRVRAYVDMRKSKTISPPHSEYSTIRSEAAVMLQEVLMRGEVTRGEMTRLAGLAERTGRMLLAQLLAEGLLTSDTPKGPVRLALPSHLVSYLFPGLYPEQLG
jgi:Fic family protein